MILELASNLICNACCNVCLIGMLYKVLLINGSRLERACRMMARGRDKAHHAQVVVHLLLHLLLLAPEFGRCAPPATAAAEAST